MFNNHEKMNERGSSFPEKNYNRERSGDSGHVNVRDDEDGHLIYIPGDVLQARCKYDRGFLFDCLVAKVKILFR